MSELNNQSVNRLRNRTIYALVIITVIALIFVIINQFMYTKYEISGRSMEETLHDGDKVLVNLWNKDINHDDIIIFHHNDEEYVKRVIAKEGDTFDIQNDNIFINDKLVSNLTTYHKPNNAESNIPQEEISSCDFTDDCKIPKGEYFVLGDNRYISKDSRHIGLIKHEDIIGKVNIRSMFNSIEKVE